MVLTGSGLKMKKRQNIRQDDQELYQGSAKADVTKGKVTGVTYLTISLPHIENFIVQTAPYDKRYISSVSLV